MLFYWPANSSACVLPQHIMTLAQMAVGGHKEGLRFFQVVDESKNTLVGRNLRERES